MPELMIIKAAGSNYDIGYTVGKTARSLIERALAGYRKALPADGWKEPWELQGYYLELAREKFSHLVEELQGMADGSGVNFSDLFFLNALEEALDYKTFSACTAIGIAGSSGVWLAHNEDWYASDSEAIIAICAHPRNKPAFISVTAAPFLAAVGMNEAGLAQGVNSVDSTDNREGIPRMFTARAVLEATSIEEACTLATPCSRAGGYNHLLVHAGGELGNLETTAAEAGFMPADKLVYHTNHYLNPSLQHLAGKASEHSFARYNRLHELEKDMMDAENKPAALKRVLSDHEKRPLSICRHADEQSDNSATIFSVIFDLKNLRAGVARGNPCGNIFTEIIL
ncbi:MAG: C45 family peptidase [Bacillota bacterium]|nr:C45 family peptidase [Bacillota bacterium]